ncbi:hypothetical protein [Marinigracilibium pacificum]|uniref:DUF4625 domain-containing protein n=1 Tax=Marinigracilibium pacificum TaxID=2729599 RepID=A0A848IZE8_9BACT|nr:hypothetical protein [Marinigracilibium pacificum]NMM47369.1 hypothetical protein [Marinigracilibium pacificum]
MKNIYKFSLLGLIVLVSSCFLEEETFSDNLSEAADIRIDGSDSYIKGETQDVTLDFEFLESSSAKISEIKGTIQLSTSNGNSDVVDLDPITSEGEVVFGQQELFNDLPVDGAVLTEDDLNPGDQWLFNFTIVMEDGRVLKSRISNAWNIDFAIP